MVDTVQEFETVKEQVMYFLENYPATRDSDKLLTLAVLNVYYDLKNNVGTYENLKAWLLNDDIPAFATITRNRAKLQEEYKDLRGKKYTERKIRAQEVSDIMTDQ